MRENPSLAAHPKVDPVPMCTSTNNLFFLQKPAAHPHPDNGFS